jgi:hypothetical protein
MTLSPFVAGGQGKAHKLDIARCDTGTAIDQFESCRVRQRLTHWKPSACHTPCSMKLRTVSTVLLWTSGFASPACASWIADQRTGCKVWDPHPLINEAVHWNGSCSNGLATGHGVPKWFKDGKPHSQYEGTYQNGRMTGHGTYTSTTSRYEGDWRDDKANGHGTMRSAKGALLVGEWKDGQLNGRGQAVSEKGDRYDGSWTMGRRSGHGVARWAEGASYDGEWADDRPNGMGIFITRDGKTYAGRWIDGCFRQGTDEFEVGRSPKECGF